MSESIKKMMHLNFSMEDEFIDITKLWREMCDEGSG